MIRKLLKPIKILLSLLPSKLPLGLSEFEVFYKSIIDLYDIPDLPSYKQAIASMIMHLGPLTTHKAKIYFAWSIRKAMANQIAYEVIQQLREDEKKKLEKPTEPPPAV